MSLKIGWGRDSISYGMVVVADVRIEGRRVGSERKREKVGKGEEREEMKGPEGG
jgi:hypothetical protein